MDFVAGFPPSHLVGNLVDELTSEVSCGCQVDAIILDFRKSVRQGLYVQVSYINYATMEKRGHPINGSIFPDKSRTEICS